MKNCSSVNDSSMTQNESSKSAGVACPSSATAAGPITAGVLCTLGLVFLVVLAIAIAITALRYSYKNKLWLFSNKATTK